jgi:hypothetical protein
MLVSACLVGVALALAAWARLADGRNGGVAARRDRIE